MSKKKKLIPELRFPDFKNEGEWETKAIGDVFKSFSGGTPNTSEREYYGGKIPFIRSAEINRDRTELFITEEGLKNSSAKIVEKGDLLIALYGANSGDSAICKINGAINQAILCLQSEYSNSFTYNFLTLKKDLIVSKFIQGGQGNLSGDIVKSITVPFPKQKEQQKIASCLSSLDDLIESHSQKLELLKDHKKGLMQNLFPNSITNYDSSITSEDDQFVIRNSQTRNLPKYRFKEFENDGEWVEKKLGEVADFINEKISAENLAIDSYISTENLLPDYAGITIMSKVPSTGNFTKFQEQDILVSNIRPYLKKVWYSNKEGGCSNDVFVIRGKSGIAKLFLAFLLRNDDFISYVMVGAKGVKMPRGDKDLISKYPISYPENLQEQQKIASCLSSLDALITAQAEKIEQLKLHKKGLMQGLFPKIKE